MTMHNTLLNSDARLPNEDQGVLRRILHSWVVGCLVVLGGLVTVAGCYHTSVDTSEYAQGPAPRRIPSPARAAQDCGTYEDRLTGGQVFTMYCSYCHNAPSLAERNFANFKNVASHMRVRANLTGKEYAKLMEFLRSWNDVGPPTPPVEPSPNRLVFSQPLNELREQKGADQADGQDPPEPLPAPQKATPK
jgi:hypothetical protein